MRKLAALEVAALISTFAIAQANPPDEVFTMPTVTVTATFNPRPVFWFTSPTVNVSPGAVPFSSSNRSSSDSARLQRALDCAKAYGSGQYKGPRSGWSTHFVENYGWVNANNKYDIKATQSATPPSGIAANPIGGVTYNDTGRSHIFRGHMPYVEQWIEAIAHEWAHQHGAVDGKPGQANDAGTIGRAVRAAYKADNGAKCGGLMQ